MDETKKFEYYLAFNCVSYAIKNRRIDLNEIIYMHIDDAKKFLYNTIKGLESIMARGAHFSEKNLREIVEFVGYKCSNDSRKNVLDMIMGFKKTTEQLNKLEKNPKEFYDDTKDAKQLSDFCNKIKELYADDYQGSE